MLALDFDHRYLPPINNDALTLLLLHGTGGDEDDLLDLGRAVHSRAALLSPRGKVLENGMPRFFRRLSEGVFDEPDLIRRTHELARFVEIACKGYARDPTKVIAVGFSNGANIAAAMLLLSPQTLRGGALLRAMVPLTPERAPALARRHVLISAGRSDPIVPFDQPTRLADMLRAAGAEVTLNWQDAGHGVVQQDVIDVGQWLVALDV
jgi:predicted esterase